MAILAGMRLALSLVLATTTLAPAAPGRDQLYRTTLLQAAPGRLLELIEELRPSESERRIVLRHSQGDAWDLMLLEPIESYSVHLGERPAEPATLELVAWREDGFYRGPPWSDLTEYDTSGLFHVEMFIALAGQRAGLVEQREMENAYLAALKRPTNAIFTRELGASWDCFTIGAYDSWTHYAEQDRIAADDEEKAAKAAGFEGAAHIGAYLRTLIRSHHDTLARPIR